MRIAVRREFVPAANDIAHHVRIALGNRSQREECRSAAGLGAHSQQLLHIGAKMGLPPWIAERLTLIVGVIPFLDVEREQIDRLAADRRPSLFSQKPYPFP
ncbi:MAG: hypothetical protein K0R75_1799 [Paenibacillaceae bacterium]|nr:hypothetical protein [Paenibacillaceae bacterium]